MWLERVSGAAQYRLRWRPVTLLSAEVREEHGIPRPQSWSRHIADALITCIYAQEPKRAAGGPERLEKLRSEVWYALMPSRFKVVLGEVPAEAALPLKSLFKEEWVHSHQMKLRRDLTRRYPVRGVPGSDLSRVAPAGRVEAPPAPGLGRGESATDVAHATAFEVLGRWGTCDEALALRQERERLGLDAGEPCPLSLVGTLEERVHERVWSPHPTTGLELLCSNLLDQPQWDFLEREPGHYAYRSSHVVRQPQRRYFCEVKPASEVPAVRTTLDASLQRRVREILCGVMKEHDPALAMAIVVDVDEGDVLAVDSLNAYGVAGYLPVLHAFTPGSTFKVVTMATALEAGVVRPEHKFDTHDGNFVTGGHRIREALGAPVGTITAEDAIVGSSNAVMAQIGMMVEDEVFQGTLKALGYGCRPEVGLGHERPGHLPGLPWKLHWTHASVSFGHEISVTFWQHTEALAAIVRGGELRPLRLIQSVEQNHVLHRVPPDPGVRVFSQATCDEVRAMMRQGALRGTGDDVAREGLIMGTKTGTAQKVETEICLHAELEHQTRPHDCDRACRRSLKGVREGHRSCYTSSMVTFGRLPDEEREVLVFVVVDEPRGRAKFGAEVAGEAAVEILATALELPARQRGQQAQRPHGGAFDEPGAGFDGRPYDDQLGALEPCHLTNHEESEAAGQPAEQPWAERWASQADVSQIDVSMEGQGQ